MKKGFTSGAYDLFHAGHVASLASASKHCDYLIVALQTDPTIDREYKNKPIQSVLERFIQLQGCKYVDEIIVYETERDLENLLGIVDIDIRFLGADWKDKDFTGKELCQQRGIQCFFTPRFHKWSSSELRNRL